MIPSGVEIYVGLEPIDLRWGLACASTTSASTEAGFRSQRHWRREEGSTSRVIEERELDDLLHGIDLEPAVRPRRRRLH